MNAFTIFGRMSLDDKDFQTKLRQAEGKTTESAKRMAESLEKVGKAFTTAGKALTVGLTGPIVAATAAALASTRALGNYADRILDLSEQTGLSTDRLQAFEQVAIQAGVSTDVLANSARQLTVRLSATGDESETFTRAVNRLGVNVRDANGNLRSMDDLLPELMRGLAGVEDATTRNALAADVFGRSSAELIPVLALGADRIDEITTEAVRMGKVLGVDALNAANDFRIQQEQLTDAFQRTWREISVALLPVMSQIVTVIETSALPAFRRFVDVIVGLIGWFQGLADWQQTVLGGLTVALALTGPLMVGFGNLLVLIPKITTAFSTLRVVMLAFAGPLGWFALAAGGVALLIAKLRGRDSLEASIDAAIERAGQLSSRLSNVNDSASLMRAVTELADYVGPPNSPARIAFVNLANEIVATSDTAEEAFARMRRAAMEMANATEIATLQTQLRLWRSQRDAQQAILQTMGASTAALQTQLDGLLAAYADVENVPIQIVREMQILREAIETNGASLAGMGRSAALAQADVASLNDLIVVAERQLAALRGETTEADASVERLSHTVAGTLTPALAEVGAIATDAAEETAELVNIPLPDPTAIVNNAGYLRDLAKAHLEAGEAAAQASVDQQNMTAVSTDSADAITDFVNVLPNVTVRLNDQATALGFVVDAYHRSAAATRDAADAQHNANMVGLEAGEITLAYNARAQELVDTQNMLDVSLGGSADAIADFAEGAKKAQTRTVASTTATVEYQRALAALGDESADVQGALVDQIAAMETLLSQLDVGTPKWIELANAIATARGELTKLTGVSTQVRGFQNQIATGVGQVTVQLATLAGQGALTATSILQSFAEMAQGVLNRVLEMAVAEMILLQIGAITRSIFTPWMIPVLVAATAAVALLIATLRGSGATGPSAPTGVIGALEARRADLVSQRERATSESEISRINQELAGVDAELRRLRDIGVVTGDSPASPTRLREQREMQFGGVPQSVQLAVATPLVEASRTMLDAANIMRDTFGSMLPGSVGFGALPPFTDVLSRMTPVLERLLQEGVSINVGQAGVRSAATPQFGFLR